MSKYLVFGHKNPDTDTIASAIAMAFYLEKMGNEAEAVAQGEMNEETSFALNYFKVEAPRIITRVANETDKVALVDHNEPLQSVDDLNDVRVDYVIDHHRINGFESAQPLYYRCEPIGCTASILFKMFREQGIDIPKAIAGLMLSAIISDTLLFKSPTCTHVDEEAAYELAKIADVNINEYGLDLLKAGTNLSSKTVDELIELDAKNFEMNGQNVRVAQVNAIGFDEMLALKGQLLTRMEEYVAENKLALFVLLVTDVLKSDSFGLVAGPNLAEVERAFNLKVQDFQIELPGVVSRKKQVVPQLTEAFEA
ncbi:manganese-dependent inorganic pyrophosphatase [Vaginisenegalia massiliensis]|uniref:manganese-dependent inorganic pyrophosphatase n=1 Tax=Vaginisenegalia massiliensis TaxID=2058294 RepID=UPI000F52358A|nr:manganese-dependent inorganic pyrophosphatase [Vaginisenegalia massiliensis]